MSHWSTPVLRKHTRWSEDGKRSVVVCSPIFIESGENPYTSLTTPVRRPAVSVSQSNCHIHAKNADMALAKPSKKVVVNPYHISAKPTSVAAASPESHDDKMMEAALAVPDPYGEARLDFSSSKQYYASLVYKARAGKPKSEWTQEAHLPASFSPTQDDKDNTPDNQGMNILKMPKKRKYGTMSSFAPTFSPAPDDIVHV